ncbi:MAG: hypothetical protein K2H16_05870 [Prevotella sp.]|nr:hypothetical protein [Prevotella sp.]
MTLHIFNPEHDLALAANSPFWTSPKAGARLRHDLGWLPALWAKSGDAVAVGDISASYSEASLLEDRLGLKYGNVLFCTLGDISAKALSDKIDRVEVWGWDLAVVNQLRRAGISRGLMPSETLLERQRALSDRAVAARLLEHLVGKHDCVCGDAAAVYNINNVDRLMKEWGGVVLKSPWSSSGRGVRIWDGTCPNTRRWMENVIRSQGHIMAERFLDKVVDFAMEFYADNDGMVRYAGLSVFATSGSAYVGNLLVSEEEKISRLSAYVPVELLRDVRESICRWMEETLSGCYVGPLGIDMMIVRSQDCDSFLLDPCVEINLRRTMGHVALTLSAFESVQNMAMKVLFDNGKYRFRIGHGDWDMESPV